MDNVLTDFGDFCFSLFISYVGALEFLIILRHLVHWSGRHADGDETDAQNLQRLKEKLREQLSIAKAREEAAETQVMKDGVAYKDGFRIVKDQEEIESLKNEIRNIEERMKRRAEMEAELARQRKIRDETKKQLERAEAELALRQEKAAKEQAEEEKRKQQAQTEEAENLRKLLAAEKEREKQQVEREAAEQQRVAEEKQRAAAAEEAAANERRILEAEKQHEAEQKRLEEQAEQERQQNTANEEAEKLRKMLQAERAREAKEEKEAEEVDKFLAAERAIEQAEGSQKIGNSITERLRQSIEEQSAEEESEQETQTEAIATRRQRKKARQQEMIAENARKFLEAEEEMVQRMVQQHTQQQQPLIPVVEEPIIKRQQATIASARPNDGITTTVKTQFGQGSNESFTLTTKPLLFPGVSDDASSNEPNSSKQSSFSTQPSDEIMTGAEDFQRSITTITLTPQQERQDPDGEDGNTPTLQYDEEYLRSLDGIKHRPLLREDGSGRRRAFKKRRSSGSSNSSRDSRTSREEELRMFTSLEEEELQSQKSGEQDFTPIKYTSEPTLKVKAHHHHHRRHKRSPAKDAHLQVDSLRSSLEMLGEESTNPWGEVVPEHYKDTEFWRREKAMSIDEEEIELEAPVTGREAEEAVEENEANMKVINTSSFEEATHEQNEAALTAMSQATAGNEATETAAETGGEDCKKSADNSDNSNLQTSHDTEARAASPARSSASPRLRRSPRIEEMDQYEERWLESENATATNTQAQHQTPITPKIEIVPAGDTAPWRDEHGLLMQGLSDFYDFQASANPSRSRDNSRNTSPVPSTPVPKDVAHALEQPTNFFDVYDDTGEGLDVADDDVRTTTFDVYDDTGKLTKTIEIAQNNVEAFIETLHEAQVIQTHTLAEFTASFTNQELYSMVQIEADERAGIKLENITPTIFIESAVDDNVDEGEMSTFVANLRNERNSRSRSHSPLPTAENLAQSLEARRTKCIKHNEELLEKLTATETNNQIGIETANNDIVEGMTTQMLESLSIAPRSTRSRSPLPSMNNIERSLESRRSKLIQHNDELFEQIAAKSDSKEGIAKNAEADSKAEMNALVATLRSDRNRARSRSPLPTMNNIERSLETRRAKLIQHNDAVFAELAAKKDTNTDTATEMREAACHEETAATDNNTNDTKKEINALVATVRLERSRSRSRSPLPTMDNIERSLDSRRTKRIKHNDELFEKLAEKVDTNEAVFDPKARNPTIDATKHSKEEVNALAVTLRLERSRSRSRSPLPNKNNQKRMQHNNIIAEKLALKTEVAEIKSEEMNTEIASKTQSILSKSENNQKSLESQENERPAEKKKVQFQSPVITIEAAEEWPLAEATKPTLHAENDFKDQEMSQLVTSLRAARSRSRSPLPLNENAYAKDQEMSTLVATLRMARSSRSRSKSPMPSQFTDTQFAVATETCAARHNRSHTPSRSQSPDFHRLLNLESSRNRTLAKETEELESILAAKQRHLDDEALFKLKTAQEETELRMLSPTQELLETEALESNDEVKALPKTERLRRLRCTPTTPEYERTLSEESRDVQRIKTEMLTRGFKRSTYVGESMELGSEFESLRRETAHFRRSKSPSPSFSSETPATENTKLTSLEKRRIQENILSELVASSSQVDENRNGAKPKIERRHSLNQSATCYDESLDMRVEVADIRREMASFQRSRSCSRSPMDERATREVAAIEAEAVRREIQDRMLDKTGFQNFQDFSRNLNADFLDDRRASDSAMIVQYRDADGGFDFEPEEYHHYRRFSLNQEQQIEEYPADDDVDENFIYVSQFELQTPDGTRTWLSEDFYGESLESLQVEESVGLAAANLAVHEGFEALLHDEEDSATGSEDERQTVVEVDDEIDTDICDFNERGPTDESHHEQSECEEAERAMDHYAGREAADWQEVSDVGEIFSNNAARNIEEGAVGGTTPAADADSFTIDQIYDDAIKNRKQSGILREFDSILLEMQKNYETRNSGRLELSDEERYALWAKTRALERAEANGSGGGGGGKKSLNVSFNEAEKRDTEMRYLGDANMSARQATRLRSRYGYVPVLQSNAAEELVEVDLNYKPKREYNWRKNFKLDEETEVERGAATTSDSSYVTNYVQRNGEYYELGADDEIGDDGEFDARKYSLGGESITLFSKSPERMLFYEEKMESVTTEKQETVVNDDTKYKAVEKKASKDSKTEKPKKKKSKKKSQRGSKEQLDRQQSQAAEDDESDNEIYSRRSSSIQMDTTSDSPRRKSRSRRSSRSSVTTNDDLFSPRSSVGFVDGLINENNSTGVLGGSLETQEPIKKKIKKRKKIKVSNANDIKEEQEQLEFVPPAAQTISATITPDSASCNVLAALSPQHSVCVTPASTESEKSLKAENTYKVVHENSTAPLTATVATATVNVSTATATVATATATVQTATATVSTTPAPTANTTHSSPALESFDMLKDANFYPLF